MRAKLIYEKEFKTEKGVKKEYCYHDEYFNELVIIYEDEDGWCTSQHIHS